MRARWGIGVLIVSGFLASMQLLSDRRLVLSQGTVAYRNCKYINYQWLSDHELLVFKPQVIQNSKRVNVITGWQAFRCDTVTGRKTPQSRLNSPDGAEGPEHAFVSPNGRWLLWRLRGSIFASEVDGKGFQEWSDQPFVEGLTSTSLYWQSDNRHFVELQRQEPAPGSRSQTIWTAVIRSVDRSAEVKIVRLPLLPELDSSRASYYAEPYVTDAGQLFTFAPFSEVGLKKRLLMVTLSPDAPPTEHAVKAPDGLYFVGQNTSDCREVVISPSGARVAWLFCARPSISPLRDWLWRYLPRATRSTRRFSLWLSNVDGSEMRELGGTDAIQYEGSPYWQGVTDVRWLPGGKRLSYEYKDMLYTISAE